MPSRVMVTVTTAVSKASPLFASTITDVNVVYSTIIGRIPAGPTLQHCVDAGRIAMNVNGLATCVETYSSRPGNKGVANRGPNLRAASGHDIANLIRKNGHHTIERLRRVHMSGDRLHRGLAPHDAHVVPLGAVLAGHMGAARLYGGCVILDCGPEPNRLGDPFAARRRLHAFARPQHVTVRVSKVSSLAGVRRSGSE